MKHKSLGFILTAILKARRDDKVSIHVVAGDMEEVSPAQSLAPVVHMDCEGW